jgi:hypothetical protein
VQQIARDQVQSSSKIGMKVLACRAQHILREINTNHASLGKRFEQLGCEPARAASGVKDQFVSTQLQARKDFLAPTDLRTGEAVISRGIPLAIFKLLSHEKLLARDLHGFSLIKETYLSAQICGSNRVQCLIQIFEDVINIFDPH